MLAQTVRSDVLRLHEEWRELGSVGTFRAYVRKSDRVLLEVLDDRPDIEKRLPKDIRAALAVAGTPPRKKRLRAEVVAAYLAELGELYIDTAKANDTLTSFLERIRTEFPTEDALRAYLASRRPLA